VATKRIRQSMLRIIVVVSYAVIVIAILNASLNARWPLRTSQHVLVSTIAMLCTDGEYCGSSIAFDEHNGNIYASESESNQIIQFAPSGNRTVVAGRQYGDPSDPYPKCLNIDGSGTYARFCRPSGIAYDAFDHSLLIADTLNNAMRKLAENGRVTTIASSGAAARCSDFDFASSHICRPTAIAVDPSRGTAWELQGSAVMRILSNRRVSVLAGSDPLGMGLAGCIGRGGKSMDATFCGVGGITADRSGVVYVSEQFDNVIDVVKANGGSEVEAGERNSQLENGFVRNIGVETYIGYRISVATEPLFHLNTNVDWDSGSPCLPPRDGAATVARFCQPQGIAEDQASGIIYVAESGAIRQVDTKSGRVSTIAIIVGDSDSCAPVDGSGTVLRICSVDSLAVDSRNHLLYFIDGNRLRKIQLP
jgi:DNA-binding beta-propeller fold protein YncE